MAGINDFLRAFNGGRVPQVGRIWEQLQPWALDLAKNAAPKWLIGTGVEETFCSVPFPNGSECVDEAIAKCIHCGRPSCINHAFVDREGDLICYPCVASFLQGEPPPPPEPKQTAEEPPQQPWGQPPPWNRPNDDGHRQRQQRTQQDAAQAHYQQEIGWACGVLGVRPESDMDAIRARHRKMSAESHPDRPNGNEQVFKDVQRAFEILRKVKGG